MDSQADHVVTITLNPAIDLTAGGRDIRLGTVNRVQWQQEDPGGKGVNVASFLAWFGINVTATGLMGRDNESPFRALFAAKGITDRFVRVAGRSRTNIKLIDEKAGPQGVTDINFPGFTADAAELDHLKGLLDDLAGKHGWFVLSGSLPDGISPTVYRDLIERLRGDGRRVVLDASGPALTAGLQAAPTIIKPNIHELSEWLGRPVTGVDGAAQAARDLHHQGVDTVIISMGPDGALFSDGRSIIHATPPPVPLRSTVGAGDAMVAGYVLGCLRGLPLAAKARLATAFSIGALSQIGPRLPPPSDVEAWCPHVAIHTVSP